MTELDIVEWLRAEAELIALPRLAEAADEIERLRSLSERRLDWRQREKGSGYSPEKSER